MYCQPPEGGAAPSGDCIDVPEVADDAVVNEDYLPIRGGGGTIVIPPHPNNHICDGKFGPGEWGHVTAARGRFTNVYFDYADGQLHILNDWIYNPERPVEPHCYNLFYAYTGGGSQSWNIRVYGNATVQVELNGERISEEDANATGAIGFGTSPLRSKQNHTIFELSFAAKAGGFGVQLHDPGPRFLCTVLEKEVNGFVGDAHKDGGGVVRVVNETDVEGCLADASRPRCVANSRRVRTTKNLYCCALDDGTDLNGWCGGSGQTLTPDKCCNQMFPGTFARSHSADGNGVTTSYCHVAETSSAMTSTTTETVPTPAATPRQTTESSALLSTSAGLAAGTTSVPTSTTSSPTTTQLAATNSVPTVSTPAATTIALGTALTAGRLNSPATGTAGDGARVAIIVSSIFGGVFCCGLLALGVRHFGRPDAVRPDEAEAATKRRQTTAAEKFVL